MSADDQALTLSLEEIGRLSSRECQLSMTTVINRHATVTLRLASLRPAGESREAGSARREVLLNGTDEDAVKIEAEYQALSIEWERLEARKQALAERRQTALVEEAKAAVRDQYNELAAKLAEAKKAKAAMDAAYTEADIVFSAIERARNTVARTGEALPPAEVELLAQIEELAPHAPPHLRAFNGRDAQLVRQVLGLRQW